MKPVVILGAAGVGRRCADIIERLGWHLLGVLDDSISDLDRSRLAERGIQYLGSSRHFCEQHPENPVVLGIGVPAIRQRVLENLTALGVSEFPAIIDPRSHLASAVSIGRGAVICSGVELSTHTVVGDFVQINPGAIIGHDVLLEDNVSINPGAVISGDVTVGESTMIGAGAIILQGLTIGNGAVIGAGSVVTRDVSDGVIVKGNPAR